MVQSQQASFKRWIAAEFRTLYREVTVYFDETANHLIADVKKSGPETLELRQIPK